MKLDKEFMKRLGLILEREVEERKTTYEEQITAEIQKRTNEIREHHKNETESEIEDSLKSMEEHVRSINLLHITVSYDIRGHDSSINFSSMNEIIGTDFLPDKINSMSLHVYHYNEDYVSIDLSFRPPLHFLFGGSVSEYTASSADEARLLKFENDLLRLFKNYQVGYHRFLYPSIRLPHIVTSSVSLIVALLVCYFLIKLISDEFTSEKKLPGLSSLLTLSIFGMYNASAIFFKVLFPFYNFSLVNKHDIWRYVRPGIWFVFGSVTLAAVYDLLKLLLFG